MNYTLDLIAQKLEKYFLHEEIVGKEITQLEFMNNFPFNDIEDLEKMEKMLKDDDVVRKELVSIENSFQYRIC